MNNNLKIARTRATRVLLPAFILLLLALGCKKIFDLKDILHQHDNDKLCQVLTITSNSATSPFSGGMLTAQFAYNKNGDPTTVALGSFQIPYLVSANSMASHSSQIRRSLQQINIYMMLMGEFPR